MLAHLNFLDADGTFSMENPENKSYLYFPLASETGLKSAVAPNLGGDAKVNQETFLLEPVSAENLHNNRSTRNFSLRWGSLVLHRQLRAPGIGALYLCAGA